MVRLLTAPEDGFPNSAEAIMMAWMAPHFTTPQVCFLLTYVLIPQTHGSPCVQSLTANIVSATYRVLEDSTAGNPGPKWTPHFLRARIAATIVKHGWVYTTDGPLRQRLIDGQTLTPDDVIASTPITDELLQKIKTHKILDDKKVKATKTHVTQKDAATREKQAGKSKGTGKRKAAGSTPPAKKPNTGKKAVGDQGDPEADGTEEQEGGNGHNEMDESGDAGDVDGEPMKEVQEEDEGEAVGNVRGLRTRNLQAGAYKEK